MGFGATVVTILIVLVVVGIIGAVGSYVLTKIAEGFKH